MTLIEGTLRWGAWRAVCAPAVCPGKAYVSPYEFYLRPGEYTVRTRREGDRLRLGSRPEKTVKRLLSEGQVSPGERGLVPVLEGEGRAAALGGFYLRDSSAFAGLLPDVLGRFSLLDAFNNFAVGHVFDIPGLLLYLSLIALLVFLTVQVLQKRRWN